MKPIHKLTPRGGPWCANAQSFELCESSWVNVTCGACALIYVKSRKKGQIESNKKRARERRPSPTCYCEAYHCPGDCGPEDAI